MRRLFGSRGSGSRQDGLLTEDAVESRATDEDWGVLAAYRKAKKQRVRKKKNEGPPKRGEDKVKREGQALNGFNRKTNPRNRRYRCDSEYHPAPKCPWRDTPRGGGSSSPQERNRPYRPPYSSTSMETPFLPRRVESVGESEAGSKCEQSLVTTVDAGDVFVASKEDSVAALETGATADLLRFSWLARHKRILERRGIPRVTSYPSKRDSALEMSALGR